MSKDWSRAIIVTPRADGTDGVSAVTRLYVQALTAQLGAGVTGLDIWSLGDEERPLFISDPRVSFRSGHGRRLRFAASGLRTSADDRTLVIVQHVHLLPVVLPLVWRGARLMVLLHGVEAWKRLRPLERAGCRAAWKIAAVSAHTAERFRSANPAFANSIVEVCPPGVATVPAAASAGLDAPYALIVGRMASDERYKGHDLLIDVWERVRKSVPRAQLVIVGGGDDQRRLARKAAELGLSEAVRFEGVVGDERLAALYRDATVFVMPSPNEGFGLVYVEAMSAGTPCIVARGAAEEIVEDGANGMVVAPGDSSALERSIVRMLTSPVDRQRMGAAAAETVRKRFTVGAFTGRLYNMLQLPHIAATC